MFFFNNHAENEAERLVPDLSLFFEKALYKVKKQVVCSLVSPYFHSPQIKRNVFLQQSCRK